MNPDSDLQMGGHLQIPTPSLAVLPPADLRALTRRHTQRTPSEGRQNLQMQAPFVNVKASQRAVRAAFGRPHKEGGFPLFVVNAVIWEALTFTNGDCIC